MSNLQIMIKNSQIIYKLWLNNLRIVIICIANKSFSIMIQIIIKLHSNHNQIINIDRIIFELWSNINKNSLIIILQLFKSWSNMIRRGLDYSIIMIQWRFKDNSNYDQILFKHYLIIGFNTFDWGSIMILDERSSNYIY